MDSGSPVVCRLARNDPCSSYFLAGIFSFNHYTGENSCDGNFTVLADLTLKSTEKEGLSNFVSDAVSYQRSQEGFMLDQGEGMCTSMLQRY